MIFSPIMAFKAFSNDILVQFFIMFEKYHSLFIRIKKYLTTLLIFQFTYNLFFPKESKPFFNCATYRSRFWKPLFKSMCQKCPICFHFFPENFAFNLFWDFQCYEEANCVFALTRNFFLSSIEFYFKRGIWR